MSGLHGSVGLWMLASTVVMMALCGLPAWLVLVANALLFALGGLLWGAFTLSILSALPARLLGLLEHDLLQALPLYVLIGAMLNRLPLATILFRVAARLTGSAQLAGLTLGALLAPMNGSVGASVTMLARALGPRLAADAQAKGGRTEADAALICAASTIGVVVPPSLVLILLGDALMRAHTEALNVTHLAERVINTQDIFHGALLPALLMLLLFFAVTWWSLRRRAKPALAATTEPVSRSDWLVALATVAGILTLLASVTLGLLYAVEAAATGGLLLLLASLAGGGMKRTLFRQILRDTLAISGALFALLVAATTYTLVLRAFETDVWIADFLKSFGSPALALAAVMLILGLSGFVLDAFEITFVLVPIVMPPLLMLVPDATWVAVLTLLVLQMSFLLPPFGYAVLMVDSVLPRKPVMRKMVRSLLPYLLVQALVLGLVLLWPQMVWHSGAAAGGAANGAAVQLSDEEVQAVFEQQRRQNEEESAASAPKN
jgi:tripartite ATP-independent transporter DctM subunit